MGVGRDNKKIRKNVHNVIYYFPLLKEKQDRKYVSEAYLVMQLVATICSHVAL